ncbi:MAG: hypothetical protein OXC10_19075 [Rhodospirillaceae bacterium]|nr:hypothetical protein [Rhodospirillaceae bacterium]
MPVEVSLWTGELSPVSYLAKPLPDYFWYCWGKKRAGDGGNGGKLPEDGGVWA